MKMLSAKAKISGLTLIKLIIMLACLAGVYPAAAQGTRFFRISGPAATSIIAFNPDGTLVWSNAQPGTNYTVQTISSLPGGTNWVDYVQLPVTSSVNTNQLIDFNPPAGMTLIPAGVFTMGDVSDGNVYGNETPINITVSAFYMDVNVVSYGLWQSVYNWATNQGYGFVDAGISRAANNPVYELDWYDCVKWCNARSQQAALTPVYYTDAGFTQVYTNGDPGNGPLSSLPIYANWSANGYHLPTEAEWEKAARGGLVGQRFPWGNTISESQANYTALPNPPNPYGYTYDLGPYEGNNTNFDTGPDPGTGGLGYTSPVGYFAPNGYGLYDMAGNISEWCWDWSATPYGQPSTTNPTGPATGIYRAMRTGYWDYGADIVNCAWRQGWNPTYIWPNDFGFRCARGF